MKHVLKLFFFAVLFAASASLLLAGGSGSAATLDPDEIDLGGRTITITSYYQPSFEAYFKDGNGRGRLETVGEMFNCDFVFENLAWTTRNPDIITSVAAGDPLGDIFVITNRSIYPLASAGAVRAMDDILDDAYYNSLPSPHNRMKEIYSSFRGKAYGISVNGFFDRNSDMQGAQGWGYNRDMVKEAGLETPNELQKRGEWTWEKMREYAKALTKDTDGDGQIDVWGLTERLDPWPVGQEMAVYLNGGGLFLQEGGKFVYGLNRPEALAAMQLWRDMVNVDKSVLIGDAANTRGEFINGKAAMIRIDLYALPNDSQFYEFDYGYVFYPKGPNGDYLNPVWGMDVALLPVTEENPAAMVAIVSALFETTSDYRDLNVYRDDVLGFFAEVVRDRDSLNVIEESLDKIRLWDNIPDDDFQRDVVGAAMVEAVFGARSPKAIMDEIAPRVQAVLDDTLNK